MLSHGPNYTVVPRCPPVAEYIASIEQACTQLKQGEAEELKRGDEDHSKEDTIPRYNITREEYKALEKLRKDKNRIILTADKGVSMVVMDKEDYFRKAEELLRQPTCKSIPTDPTNKYKNKLISLLKPSRQKVGLMMSSIEGSTLQGRFPQVLWVTQGAKERGATQTHSFQHRGCNI